MSDSTDTLDEEFEKLKLNKMTISVTDPMTEGGWGRRYTTFLIRTEKFSVRRRYSDFVWLRSNLEGTFVGMCIPPLPEKNRNMFANNSKEFVELRRVGLQLFLDAVVDNPFLANSPVLNDFLSIQKGSKWDARKKETNEKESDAEVLWRKMSLKGKTEDEDHVARVLADVLRQLSETETVLKQTLLSRKQSHAASKESVEATKGLLDALKAYHLVERTCGDAKKVEYVDKSYTKMYVSPLSLSEDHLHVKTKTNNNNRYAHVQEDTEEVLEKSINLDSFDCKIEEMIMLETLKFYLADIGCMKALIDERRFSKDEMERADRALKQSRVALKRLETAATKNADKVLKAAKKTQECEDKHNACELRFRVITGSLMSDEFERMSRRKISTIKSLISMSSISSLALSKERSKFWHEFLVSVSSCIGTEQEKVLRRRRSNSSSKSDSEKEVVSAPIDNEDI